MGGGRPLPEIMGPPRGGIPLGYPFPTTDALRPIPVGIPRSSIRCVVIEFAREFAANVRVSTPGYRFEVKLINGFSFNGSKLACEATLGLRPLFLPPKDIKRPSFGPGNGFPRIAGLETCFVRARRPVTDIISKLSPPVINCR